MNEIDEINERIRPKFSEMEIYDVLMKTLGTTKYDFMVDIIIDKLNEEYIHRNFSNIYDEIDK